jgi:hypothetical protein
VKQKLEVRRGRFVEQPIAMGREQIRLALNKPQMETKMRKRVLSILGALVIAALTIPTANAASPRVPKAARAPAPVAHQFRDAFGSAPKPIGSKSCDIFWCHEN